MTYSFFIYLFFLWNIFCGYMRETLVGPACYFDKLIQRKSGHTTWFWKWRDWYGNKRAHCTNMSFAVRLVEAKGLRGRADRIARLTFRGNGRHLCKNPCIMSQNGQTHFKNRAANAARFLKYVWPLWNIMQ